MIIRLSKTIPLHNLPIYNIYKIYIGLPPAKNARNSDKHTVSRERLMESHKILLCNRRRIQHRLRQPRVFHTMSPLHNNIDSFSDPPQTETRHQRPKIINQRSLIRYLRFSQPRFLCFSVYAAVRQFSGESTLNCVFF